jgi:uncharacterized protein
MDYDHALRLLREHFGDNNIARHSIATSRKAVEIAEKIRKAGHPVDIELVSVGALLHDIGRCRTHDIEHNYEGGRLLREMGFEELARAVERHGSNVFDEIHPSELTLEEKIIYLADKLTEEDGYVTLDERFRSVVQRRRQHGKAHEIPLIEKAVKVTKEIEKEVNALMNG